MNQKIKTIARTGFVAKGVVYAVTGILTFLAAFDLGGKKSGRLQVLEFLDDQTFGNLLLLLMAAGLVAYSCWRFVQSVADPEHIGSDLKGRARRVAFFISGLSYLGLAVLAALRVFGSRNSSGSGATQNVSFLSNEIALIAIGIAGGAIIVAGIYQFISAYRNDYTSKFGLDSLGDEEKRKSIEKTAKFGLSARGVIFLIIGYFALKAALDSNPSKIKTTREAFSFIQDSSYGAWLLGLVAAGLVAYSLYMFLLARYRKFKD